MQVLFQTRFSFFGKSGWQSAASKKPEELFENSRLEQRLHYFEHIAVASLRSQDDKDFKLAVLSSDLMPKPFQRRLSAMCYDVLGRHRVDVMFRGPGSAGAIFRRFVARRASDSANVAQVVLDDDDAVSSNFVGMCRAEAISALRLSTNAERYCFLSFPQGATMVLERGTAQFFNRDVAMTNLGLTLVAASSTRRNPYMTAHKKLTRRHPVRLLYGSGPAYIRTVHGQNDSRAMIKGDALNAREMDQLYSRFPFLQSALRDSLAPQFGLEQPGMAAERPAA